MEGVWGSPLQHTRTHTHVHTHTYLKQTELKGPQRGVFTLTGVRDHFRPRDSTEGRQGGINSESDGRQRADRRL